MQKITAEKVKFSTIPSLTDTTVKVLVNDFYYFSLCDSVYTHTHTHRIRVMLIHNAFYSFLFSSHLIFIGADYFPQMSFPPEWSLSWAFDFLFSSLFQASFGLFQALALSLKELCPFGLAPLGAPWLLCDSVFTCSLAGGRWQEMAAPGNREKEQTRDSLKSQIPVLLY